MYLCRHRQSGRVKESMDFPPPNVEYPLQESPDMQQSHKDLSNNAEGQADGGYGSGDTPTTISPAESAGSISYGSEYTVPIYAESGPPAGASRVHVPSTLPFAPTQFSSELVLDQLQSRTSDNKDREDMDKKVHTILTEVNNNNNNYC